MSQLDLTFAALADPTRRAILARLTEGEASVAELAKPFEISVRAVSMHVGVLQKAGLVSRTKSAQRRPSKLELSPLIELDQWLNAYRRLWEGRFDRMEETLELIQRKPS